MICWGDSPPAPPPAGGGANLKDLMSNNEF